MHDIFVIPGHLKCPLFFIGILQKILTKWGHDNLSDRLRVKCSFLQNEINTLETEANHGILRRFF
jgi:hypothetical protein